MKIEKELNNRTFLPAGKQGIKNAEGHFELQGIYTFPFFVHLF